MNGARLRAKPNANALLDEGSLSDSWLGGLEARFWTGYRASSCEALLARYNSEAIGGIVRSAPQPDAAFNQFSCNMHWPRRLKNTRRQETGFPIPSRRMN